MIPITCALNPLSGREASMPAVPKAETPRRVAVVGAGPAGLMAAATAAERGHEVILLERSDRHGGQSNLCLLYTSGVGEGEGPLFQKGPFPLPNNSYSIPNKRAALP